MAGVTLTEQDGVQILTLDDGRVNVLGTTMLSALVEAGESLAATRKAVVITAPGRTFSAGLDLAELTAMDRPALGRFLELFERMCRTWFRYPRPVVAAVNGHAIAGGLILALTADLRLVAKTELKMGLSELALGIPFPSSALELVRHTVSAASLSRVLLAGEMFGPEAALGAGLVDGVVEPASLVPEAVALAARLGAAPGSAYSLTKEALRATTSRLIDQSQGTGREAFLDAFLAPAIRAHIQAQLEALKNRKK
jgi:enoyl-CoA hydratase